MITKRKTNKPTAEKTVRDIRRATRRKYSAEEKLRIVMEGLRAEVSVTELCCKEGINPNVYYRWSKEFLEAARKPLAGDAAREATSDEVRKLRKEVLDLNGMVSPAGSEISILGLNHQRTRRGVLR